MDKAKAAEPVVLSLDETEAFVMVTMMSNGLAQCGAVLQETIEFATTMCEVESIAWSMQKTVKSCRRIVDRAPDSKAKHLYNRVERRLIAALEGTARAFEHVHASEVDDLTQVH